MEVLCGHISVSFAPRTRLRALTVLTHSSIFQAHNEVSAAALQRLEETWGQNASKRDLK